MDFSPNKTSIEVIRESAFGGIILETFILVLMINGTKIDEKNLIS